MFPTRRTFFGARHWSRTTPPLIIPQNGSVSNGRTLSCGPGTGWVPPPPPLHRNQDRQCLQHAGGSCSPSATHVLLRGVVGHLLVRVGTAHRTGGEAWPPVTFADDGAPAPCGHHFGAQAALSAACHQFANHINLCAGDDVERSGWHHRRYAVPFPGPNSLPLRHRLEQ